MPKQDRFNGSGGSGVNQAKRITAALQGHWYGHYGSACCPAHGDKRPSLTVADGYSGCLLATCHAGCTFTAILSAMRGLGLVEGGGTYKPPDPAIQAHRRAEELAKAAKRAAQAHRLWTDAQPVTGTLAEVYLRGRGITCPLPDTLRFIPSCWHPTAQRFPALVAMVEGGDSFAVHRTYLAPDGSGKAIVTPSKAMLGQCRGGAVRLSDAQGPLVVAEGIETALSLASGLLRGPATVWAALSTSGMTSLHLPSHPSRLTIAADGDKPGRKAAHAFAERATSLGWRVSLLPAPEGSDWNDILKGGAA